MSVQEVFGWTHDEIRALMDGNPVPTDPKQRRAFIGILFQRGKAADPEFFVKSLLAGFLPWEFEEARRANTKFLRSK